MLLLTFESYIITVIAEESKRSQIMSVAVTVLTQVQIILMSKAASSPPPTTTGFQCKYSTSKSSPRILREKDIIEQGFAMSLLKMNSVPVSRKRK